MSPSIEPNDIKPALERRQTYRPLRLGKTFPGLPVRDRRRNSGASIWVLAICIVIALILRCTSNAASQENLASYTPVAIEYLKDSEIVAYSNSGASAHLLSLATGSGMVALFTDRARV